MDITRQGLFDVKDSHLVKSGEERIHCKYCKTSILLQFYDRHIHSKKHIDNLLNGINKKFENQSIYQLN